LAQGGRRGIYCRENLAVGSKSRESSAVSLAPPDFRLDCPTVAKKHPSSAVRRAARFFRPRVRLGRTWGRTFCQEKTSTRKW
jgi:hypothetical protein